jgi:hypothetical protein
MKMHILPLQHAADLKEQLERDGWKCRELENGACEASHGQVVTETDARERLYLLGLLTSRDCLIHFSPFCNCPKNGDEAICRN